MAKATDILVKIGADVAGFKKAMQEAQKETTGLGKQFDNFATKTSKISAVFQSMGKTLTMGITVPFVTLATAAGALAIKSGNAADKLLDLEQITGLSTDRLQELEYVAADAGVSFDGLTGVMTQFTGKIPELLSGASESARALEFLGISLRDQQGNLRDTDSLFPEIVKSLQNVTNVTERNALSQKVFGESLKDLGPVLGYTNAQFDALLKSAHEAGVVMSRDDIVAANAFRAEMDKLKLQFDKSIVSLGNVLIPLLKDTLTSAMQTAIEKINEFRDWWASLDESTQNTIVNMGLFVASIGPVLLITGKLIAAFKSAAIVIGAMRLAFAGQALATGAGTAALVVHEVATIAATVASKAFNLVLAANPAVLVIAAIAALGVGLYALSQKTEKNTETERRAAAQKNALKTAIEGLTDASQKQLEITRNITSAWEREGATIGQQIQSLKNNNNELIRDVKRGFGELGKLSEEQYKKYQDQIAANNSEIKRLEQQQQQESTNRRKAFNSQWLKDQEEAQKKYNDLISKHGKTEGQLLTMQYNIDIKELETAQNRKLISHEQYEKARLAITEQYSEKMGEIQKKSLKETLSSVSSGISQFGSVVSSIGNIADGFFQADIDRIDQRLERQLAALEEEKNAKISAYIEDEETELEKQERSVTELEAMLAKTTNAKDAAALKESLREKKSSIAKLKIENDYDIKKAKLEENAEKRKRDILREQAKTSKAISIFQILISTATAIMQALNSPPPASFIFAGIAAAMGVAQLALAAAQPLPLAEGGLFPAKTGGNLTYVKTAEAGYDEAFIPLSPEVFSRIGDGIIEALLRKVGQLNSYVSRTSEAISQAREIIVEQHITVQGGDVTVDTEKVGSIATRMFRNRLILVDSGAIV